MVSFRGIRICFLADKHDLQDDRIYWKMAVPMQRLGAEVHYYSIGSDAEEGTTPEGVHYRIWKLKTHAKNTCVNFLFKRLDPFNNYGKLYRACAELQADIYHFHDLWINRIGPKLKALPHNPVVFYDAREPYAEDYRSFYGSGRLSRFLIGIFASWVDHWEKKNALRYDLVIANEPRVRAEFAKVVGDERAITLYNYADMELFDPAERSDKASMDEVKKYHLLYCGLLTEERGVWNLLESVRVAKERIPEIKVLLLGKMDPPGLREDVRAYIARQGLENTIEIQSQVPYKQVGAYYRRSRVGLLLWRPFPSLKIKMPIKLFEYMAFGLPVIGSDFGHIGKTIQKEGCGIAVDPENVEKVAEAIETVLRNEDLYARMRNKGIEATRTRYSWPVEFDRLCSHYKKALNERQI